MKNFGEIFKRFRESRGFKLKDIAKAGISTSQLSRFEKGETDLTLTKFMLALNKINIPIDEFIYAARDFHRDELNELLEKMKIYLINHDVKGMKRLLITEMEKEEKSQKFHQLNIILLKIRLQELSKEQYYNESDIKILTDYLFRVDYWGNYELLLFMNTLDTLNHKTFIFLSQEMVRRTDFYDEKYAVYYNDLVKKFSTLGIHFLTSPFCHPWSLAIKNNLEYSSPLYCPAQKTEFEIDMHGNVYPCPFLHNPEHLMGNLIHEDFEKVWYSGVKQLNKTAWSTNDKCKSCVLFNDCGGGCYAMAYVSQLSYDKRCILHEN